MKTDVDIFIADFPKRTRLLLEQLRQTIKKASPKAEEVICYGIPTFTQNGNLVHFSAFKHHIGFYPTSSGIQAFKKELSNNKSSKDSVQFPLDKPLPLNLISRMVKFRVKENSMLKPKKQLCS